MPQPRGDLAPDLLTASAVRERAHLLLGKAEQGVLKHFAVNLDRLPALADAVAGLTRRRYPDGDIPCHARWRHFTANGHNRWSELAQRAGWRDASERARAAFDLAIVSVLLDAGAGPDWSYRDGTGTCLSRSEGLAIASIEMFDAGCFSQDRLDPLRVDAERLQALSEEELGRRLQVNATNPLVGLSGRHALLRSLGAAVAAQPEVFALADRPRPGGMFDHLSSLAENGGLAAPAILASVLRHLGCLWPGRISLGGVNLGDTWRHDGIETQDETHGLVPLHKLSQWLTYSLVEPVREAGIDVLRLDDLTGLAEYRNGGMLLDAGVLQLKEPAEHGRSHRVGDELVVEWRALTVALLDRLAPLVRRSLGQAGLPLGNILEGGTWALGRQLAFERRADGSPPLKIVSDGTVF